MEARVVESDTLAPWAEIVPNVGTMTADDLTTLPEDGYRYELIEGVLVRVPWSGGEASDVAMGLGSRLRIYVEDHDIGRVLGADAGYRPDPLHPDTTEMAPDVSFVRADRVPPRGTAAYRKAWRLAPDLAVEVASPYQSRRVMGKKAKLYLSFGTRLVWVIYPRFEQVDIWHTGDSKPSATLGVGDTLDGEGVVPGFRYPIASLFR